MKIKSLTGVTKKDVRDYEIAHSRLSKTAATEGFVLLKNEGNLLPLKMGSSLALYGAGAVVTIKGGTGSGDVNERYVVSIYEGLLNAGFDLTTKEWLESYKTIYQIEREIWRDEIWAKLSNTDLTQFFSIYSSTKFHIPAGSMPDKTETETAIYVISRVAGEGADRCAKQGDYYLDDDEDAILRKICEMYEHVIVLINTGGIVDCSFLDQYSVDSVLYISQPGMEAGNAVADVLAGKVTPSGKLTDTWAFRYEDYPNYQNYSHNNGNVEKEYYSEGIYVGYRYFDTFQIPVRFGFGFGLSYTEFEWKLESIEKTVGINPSFTVKAKVKNTGIVYAGREVLQVYIACPQKEQNKEFRRLTGFVKTELLAPGQEESVTVSWTLDQMTSYDELRAAWVLEHGCYGIYVGGSLESAVLTGSIRMSESAIRVKTQNICPLKEKLEELAYDRYVLLSRIAQMEKEAESLYSLSLTPADVVTEQISYGGDDFLTQSKEAAYVDTLTTEQLIKLATGDTGKGQSSSLGSSGFSVPGSAAETSHCAIEQGLESIVLADGPAGLRLNRSYQVKDGDIVPVTLDMSIENGFLYRGKRDAEGETYYQYCTAIPVGTLLAQTWDKSLVEKIGRAIGEEMNLFHIALWLAPGLCIHRNPLCGRNFEYYSEDPFVSGMIAAAMTDGVQSVNGCGTTIKHFCCNNQEDNRMGSDSIVSERTLREIYMKGFEIAVKKSQPLSIMTSYNLVNGVHAANNYDICTKAAREEWKFEGVFMTDWATTHKGPDCTASGCIRAGNDLVMPGITNDHENLRQELESGALLLKDLKRSITHLVNVIWKLN